MNEQTPAVDDVGLPPASYKDRSAGLKVFGVLTILLGVVAGLFSILMLVGLMASRNTDAPPTSVQGIVLAVGMYLFLAVAFIWLGVGSIQARRWARALLLIISWSWLVIGVTTMIGMAVFLPKILAGISGATDKNQALPPSAQAGMAGVMTVMFVIFAVIFIIMPIIWTVFYQSRDVKATCEARDTSARWTDACPSPVLALSLWMAVCVPWLLAMPFTGHPLIPLFGIFLTGLPATLASLVLAAISIWAVWLLYKVDIRGWWVALITMVLYWVSTVLTDLRYDFNDVYRLMGYSQAQLEQLQKFTVFGQHMGWTSSLLMLPFIGYILFIRKYFLRRSVALQTPQA